MFRSFKYLFLFLLILGGIVYLFNFVENYEEYEYLSYLEYEMDMFYDLDSIIDWEAIDWDEIDIDLLEELGFEEYFGLAGDAPVDPSNEPSASSPKGLWILGLGLGATVLSYFKQ
jgi:hypothetical protein